MTPRRLSFLLPLVGLVMLGAWTRTEAASLANFGRCLRSSGAVFYGTTWCPHCRSQRVMLGDAMDQVRYVECSDPDDPDRPASACRAVHVNSYPTWIFGDGSRKSGELSLSHLAARTGCALPGGAEAAPPAGAPRTGDAAQPAVRTMSHGAKIIEVPD